jgi:hypothetical protein
MTAKTPTHEQAIRLNNLYSELVAALVQHAGGLFSDHGLNRPVAGDAAGRDLFAVLSDTHPHLVQHMRLIFGEWIDGLNAMTEAATRDRDAILQSPTTNPPSIN